MDKILKELDNKLINEGLKRVESVKACKGYTDKQTSDTQQFVNLKFKRKLQNSNDLTLELNSMSNQIKLYQQNMKENQDILESTYDLFHFLKILDIEVKKG